MLLMDGVENLVRAGAGMCARIFREARGCPGMTTLLVVAAVLGSGGAVALALIAAVLAYVLLGGIRQDRTEQAMRREHALHRHVFGD